MKPMRYISLIIALLSVLGLAAQQQQSQYALYNYRNDGDFNAWLNIYVDSITYSNIGLDSVEYDNIVTQEVWTPDSCYRIPIEVIDSIGFRAPAPEFKDGIFHITEEHIPYTVVVDSLSVTFDSSIPASMLPAVGQVVISDVYGEPYDAGFAGRVVNIVYADGTTRIECEEVGLEDVYDQLICVGKTIAYEDDDNIYSSRRRSPRKIKINEDGTIEVPLGKFSHKFKYGSNASLVLSAEPSLNFDYIVVYNVKGIDDYMKLTFRSRMKYGLDLQVSLNEKKDVNDYLDFIPIETGIPGLRCKIRYGAFIEAEGKISLDWKETFVTEDCYGFDSTLDENKGFFCRKNSEWEEPDLSLNIDGSIFFGPCMQVFCYILYEKWFPSAKFNVKPGIEVAGKVEFNDDFFTQNGHSAYDLLQNTKVSLNGMLKADASANFLGKKYELLSYKLSPEFLKYELYLFPKFTEPALQRADNNKFIPSALYSEVTRRTLIPMKLGIGVYDDSDNVVSEKFEADNYWFRSSQPQGSSQKKKYISEDMKDYPTGTKYRVRPILRNGLFGTIMASPVTEFTVPDMMTLEKDTIVMQMEKTAYVAINGGWGDYMAATSNGQVCYCKVVNVNDKSFVKIVASKDMKGMASVAVKDLRVGTTETIHVIVSDDSEQEEHLTVSDENLSLKENDKTIVLILSGSGNYTIESSNADVASVMIEEDEIIISAISKGSAFITVTDTETEEEVVIKVSVTNDTTHVTDIVLSKTSLSLQPNDTYSLTATVMPEDAENKTVAWESSNVNVATVDSDGLVTAVAEGSCVITCSATDGSGVFAECQVTVTSGTTPDPGNHAWVDLGLPSGTLWATCNVGANSPEEYGSYFAWGETEPKSVFNWNNYKFYTKGSSGGSVGNSFTKYCTQSNYGYNGFTDNKTGLDSEDDAATVNWGTGWRTPSRAQVEELYNKNYTVKEWTTQNGVKGCKITSKSNANSIFLPAAGYRPDASLWSEGRSGYYWTCSLSTLNSASAVSLLFSSNNSIGNADTARYDGCSVRPVRVQE